MRCFMPPSIGLVWCSNRVEGIAALRFLRRVRIIPKFWKDLDPTPSCIPRPSRVDGISIPRRRRQSKSCFDKIVMLTGKTTSPQYPRTALPQIFNRGRNDIAIDTYRFLILFHNGCIRIPATDVKDGGYYLCKQIQLWSLPWRKCRFLFIGCVRPRILRINQPMSNRMDACCCCISFSPYLVAIRSACAVQ